MIFLVCRPAMKVSIWSDHSSNIFGVSNNLHFTEFFTILRDPSPQRIMLFVAILNPAAFAIIQVKASNAVDRTECTCQCSQEFKETIMNARKKWETPMAPAMPCKTNKKEM